MAAEFVLSPASSHTHTVIFLHGKNNTASEFAEEIFESQASDDRTLPEIFHSIKWVFPSSGRSPCARFGGEEPQWFDVWSVQDPEEREEMQAAGLIQSVERVAEIIKREVEQVPSGKSQHVILAGISQGCATAFHALLCSELRLGGFFGLCSWLAQRRRLEDIHADEGKWRSFSREFAEALKTPVFLEHCKNDEVVPFGNGVLLKDTLRRLGMRVEWREYEECGEVENGHWLNEPEGVDDVVAFMRGCVGAR
ncbi:alpha/beta-hydrolase [Aulographum hederae CBS 113979]|uniref:Alpha/beta-hydrolase n=1 Tax=Aulographum hederae CBS 113979 TaxID=1176131 RepID=A0A6G1GT60_9PEZI|nr:alpha/beta-hydrolase [Aulographum hederae CBS 113979]